jgi:hypothetical protein
MVRLRPITSSSAPKRSRQKPFARITVRAVPGESSSALNRRPRAGFTPRSGRVPSVTLIAGTSSGSEVPVTVTRPLSHMPMPSKDRLRSW